MKKLVYFLPMPFCLYLLNKIDSSNILGVIFFLVSLLFFLRFETIENLKIRKTIKITLSHFLFLYEYLGFVFIIILFIKILRIINTNIDNFFAIEDYNYKFLFIALYIIFAVKSFYNHRIIKVKSYDIYLNKDIKDKKILFISDIHMSEVREKNYIKNLCKKIKDIEKDMLIIGGDTLEYDARDLENTTYLKDLKEGLRGEKIYSILGNHDYYGDYNRNMEFLEAVNINIIRDKSIIFDDIEIIFRESRLNKNRKKLKNLIKTNLPKIVVDHKPFLRETLENKIDLQLSGHTHGGQIFPLNLFYRIRYKVVSGYKRINDFQIIVSSGVGVGFFTYRTFSRGEIVLINLKGRRK